MKERLIKIWIKMKENKKFTIAIIAVVILLIIIALIMNLTNRSYKKTIKEFVNAMNDNSKISDFIDNYFDARAYYAYSTADYGEWDNQFEKKYKEVNKEYLEEIKNDVKNGFHFSKGNYEIIKIDKLEKYDKCKYLNKAKATITCDGEKGELTFLFYKGKMIGFE